MTVLRCALPHAPITAPGPVREVVAPLVQPDAAMRALPNVRASAGTHAPALAPRYAPLHVPEAAPVPAPVVARAVAGPAHMVVPPVPAPAPVSATTAAWPRGNLRPTTAWAPTSSWTRSSERRIWRGVRSSSCTSSPAGALHLRTVRWWSSMMRLWQRPQRPCSQTARRPDTARPGLPAKYTPPLTWHPTSSL